MGWIFKKWLSTSKHNDGKLNGKTHSSSINTEIENRIQALLSIDFFIINRKKFDDIKVGFLVLYKDDTMDAFYRYSTVAF